MNVPVEKRIFGSSCPVFKVKCYKMDCTDRCKHETTRATGNDPTTLTVVSTTPAIEPKKLDIIPAKPPCHSGMNGIGAVGNMRLWAGKQAACMHTSPVGEPWALVISLLGDDVYFNRGEVLVGGNTAARDLFPEGLFVTKAPTPFMHLDWPDYGAPALDRAWWSAFLTALTKIDGDVAVFCMGGHGRTGTFLAICANLFGWSGDGDPVAWVRDIYCRETVESDEQIAYIQAITGCDVKSEAIHSDLFYNTGGNGYSNGYASSKFWDNPVAKYNVDKELPQQPVALSKNEYKKFAKALRKAGQHAPPLGELEDGAEVIYDGLIWMWNKVDNSFEYLGDAGEEEATKGD